MEYIILDLEWNQPVSRSRMIKSPIRLSGEIIQMGAVKVNEKLEILDTFDVDIKPVYYKKMNKVVSDITGIKTDDLEEGIPFTEAIEKFRLWCNGEVFVTWGPCDCQMLVDNMHIHNVDSSWLPEMYDAQEIFDDQVTMEGRQLALSYAIFFFKIKPFEAHNALNDTLNTVNVLEKLNFLKGIEAQREYYYANVM